MRYSLSYLEGWCYSECKIKRKKIISTINNEKPSFEFGIIFQFQNLGH